MVQTLPRVAVVIPSWNGVGDLRECLASLEAQQGVELEVMVVDNGSTDGSVELLNSDGVPHLELPRNIGFAPAVNLGVSSTDSELVVVLNADTVLAPDAIADLAANMSGDSRLGGVQPRILSLLQGQNQDADDPNALVYSLGQALTADGRAFEVGMGQRQGDGGFESGEIFGVCGAACLLRRELFDQLGGFDERYFAFYEDVDLNVRARVAGWSFHLVPTAVVWHVGNAAWRAGFDRPDADNARLVARNRLCTQVKFIPLRSLPRIALVELGSILRAIRARRLWPTLAGKLTAAAMLPRLLRDRSRLRKTGDLELARRWLGRGEGRPETSRRDP